MSAKQLIGQAVIQTDIILQDQVGLDPSPAQHLRSVGGALYWGATEITPCSPMLNPMTTAGDLIAGGVAGAPARLGIGTAGQVLGVVAGVPAWLTLSGFLLAANNLSDLASASAARTNLGLGTIATYAATAFQLANANLASIAALPDYAGWLFDNGLGGFSYSTPTAAQVGAEPALGNPAINGYLLASTTAGVRSWIAAPATGVTSVGLSMPGDFTVTNSPVTATGTLTAAWATQAPNSVLAGPVSGSAAAPTFRALAAADIPALSYAPSVLTSTYIYVGSAGGVATGVAVSGDSTITAAGAMTNVGLRGVSIPSLAAGYLHYTGSAFEWAAGSGSVTGANPSASVGLAAVNGTAATYLRSDGAPALSQSITPTWTGAHIFNNAGNGFAPISLSSCAPQAPIHGNDGNAVPAKLLSVNGVLFGMASRQGDQATWALVSISSGAPYHAGTLRGNRALGTAAAPTAVASGNELLRMEGAGYDGSNYVTASAWISLVVDGTVASSSVPAAITFWTGTNYNATETARFTSGRNLLIGTTSSTGLTGAGGLSVGSATDASSTSAAAIVTAGGIAAAKKAYIGTGLNLSSLTASTLLVADASKNIVSLANGIGYLYDDGSGALSYVAAPTAVAANPTASHATNAAINGSAATFMRSDAVPAISTTAVLQLARIGFGQAADSALLIDALGAHVSGVGIARFKGTATSGFLTLDTTTGSGGESGFLLAVGGTLIGQFGARQSDNKVYIKNRVFGTTEVATADSAGQFAVVTTTDATSSTTGSLVTAGGLGVAKQLRVGNGLTVTTGFGCNGAAAQTAYASGGALASYATGSYGYDTAAHASALYAMVVAMRAALVANGIMS